MNASQIVASLLDISITEVHSRGNSSLLSGDQTININYHPIIIEGRDSYKDSELVPTSKGRRYEDVTRYDEQGYQYMSSCEECGVLVYNETQHNEWHTALVIAHRIDPAPFGKLGIR
jgi:MoaA/NifB/PqqE/SkfB family radical SAM enzyme